MEHYYLLGGHMCYISKYLKKFNQPVSVLSQALERLELYFGLHIQVYHMMSQLDEDLSGRLDYKKFLNELFRPESQCSSRVSTRQSGLLPLSRQSLRQSVMSEHRAASRGGSRMSAMY